MKPLLHSAPLEQPPVGHPSRRQVLRSALAGLGGMGGLLALSGCAEPPLETVALGYGGVLSLRLSPNGEQALVGSVCSKAPGCRTGGPNSAWPA